MRMGLKYVIPTMAVGVATAFLVAPWAGADPDDASAPSPAPTPAPVTVTVQAPAPSVADGQSCTSGATSSKCIKNGDAELNASMPAPYLGGQAAYGPFYAGEGQSKSNKP